MEWVNVNVNTPTRVYLGFLFPILICDYLQVNLMYDVIYDVIQLNVLTHRQPY